MDTDLAIWVTAWQRDEDGVLLAGDSFDGEYGFGSGDRNYFDGPVCMVNASERRVLSEASVQTVHVARAAWGWRINAEALLTCPFLLCSDPDMTMVFHGLVSMRAPTESIEMFRRDSYGASYTGFVGERPAVLTPRDEHTAMLSVFGTSSQPVSGELRVESAVFEDLLATVAVRAA